MRKTFLFIIFYSLSYCAFAQFQIGIFGGTSNYQGDLIDKFYKHTKPAIGLTASYKLKERLVLRAGLTFAKLAGADSTSDKDYLRLRNLSFETKLTEFSLVAQLQTFSLEQKRWTPYVFAGIALFHFDPYTYDAGEKVFLRPLSTEGQGMNGYANSPYKLTQIAIPFGGGVKFAITDRLILGAELGLRKLNTDYLDDLSTNYVDPNDLLTQRGQTAVNVSYRGDEVAGGDPNYPTKGAQRGGAKQKDWYYFTGLHLSFRLGQGSESTFAGRSGNKKSYGCPKVPY